MHGRAVTVIQIIVDALSYCHVSENCHVMYNHCQMHVLHKTYAACTRKAVFDEMTIMFRINIT